MKPLIFPSKHGGYPDSCPGNLASENDDFGYEDVERHMRSIAKDLRGPPVIVSAVAIMVLLSLITLANSFIVNKESNEFQTVMFLCILSGICHFTVSFVTTRARFVACKYSVTPLVDRLPVEEYQKQIEAIGRCFWVLEWVQSLGLFLFGLSWVYTFYAVFMSFRH